MRDSKSKSDLKTALKVDTSVRLQPKPNDVNINGCAQLWSTSWPNDGTVKNLADTLLELVLSYLMVNSDLYLVFNRYYKLSIKGLT